MFFSALTLGATPILLHSRWPQSQQLQVASECNVTSLYSDDLAGLTKFNPVSDEQTQLSLSPAVVLFTSGSMGRPKGVILNTSALAVSATALTKVISFSAGDRWLVALPLYHVGGLAILFRSLVSGGAVVLPHEEESLLQTIVGQKVTHLSLVPTQLRRLLQEKEFTSDCEGRQRRLLIGGSALPQELIQEAIERGFLIYTSYGMTETSSACVVGLCGKGAARQPSKTIVLRSGEIHVNAEQEIQIRGESLFSGYLKQGEVVKPFDNDAWFSTGDMGAFDKHGVLRIIGRKDSMFISGGENIHPEEIENALRTLTDVAEAVVVPIDDQEFGQRPVAFLSLSAGSILDEQFVSNSKSALREVLASFKIPVQIFEMPAEFRNVGPKPDRVALQKIATQLLTKQRR